MTCSTAFKRREMTEEFHNLLEKNGYHKRQIRQCMEKSKRKQNRKTVQMKNDNKSNKLPLILDYINENSIRRINRLIKRHDLNIRLVSKPGPSLSKVLNKENKFNKHNNCSICDQLPQHNCKTKNVVYKFICNTCSEIYIGQTARPFYFRYNEHKYSLNKKNFNSALSEHMIVEHKNLVCSIDNFSLSFIDVFRTPLESKIGEAKWIECLRPALNRKQELACW